MKFSESTLAILKNFAEINDSLLFNEGDKLDTISSQKVIVGSAILEEKLPRKFAIFDLKQFYTAYEMIEDVDLEFNEKFVLLKGKGRLLKYIYASERQVQGLPKKIEFPKPDVVLSLSAEHLKELKNVARVMELPEVAFVGENGKVLIKILDSKNSSNHSYSIDLETDAHVDFSIVFKVENLKMLDGAYDVELSSKGISHFSHTKKDLEYWVSAERAVSTFNGVPLKGGAAPTPTPKEENDEDEESFPSDDDDE